LLTYPDLIIQTHWITWQPTRTWAVILAFIAAITLLSLTQISEFLYFQF